MSPTDERTARRAQHLLLVAVVALLLVGGVATSGRFDHTTGTGAAPAARQGVRHPGDALPIVAPPRAAVLRTIRATAARSTLRWLALLVAVVVVGLARRRRSTSDALPFVRTVVSRDLVRRRGPPALARS